MPMPSVVSWSRVEHAAALATLLFAVACGGEQAPVKQRPRGPTQPPAPTAAAPEPAKPKSTSDWQSPIPAAQVTPEPVAPEPVAAEAEKPEETKRDFREELEQQMAGSAACVQPRAASDGPSKMTIGLRATVMPSGAVGFTEVSAPGLATGEAACVRRMLEGVRFAPPIENAPFSVSGTVTLEKQTKPSAQAGTASTSR